MEHLCRLTHIIKDSVFTFLLNAEDWVLLDIEPEVEYDKQDISVGINTCGKKALKQMFINRERQAAVLIPQRSLANLRDILGFDSPGWVEMASHLYLHLDYGIEGNFVSPCG